MCGVNTQSDTLGILPVQLSLPHHSVWINFEKPAGSWAGSTQCTCQFSEGLLANHSFVQDELCCFQIWAGFVPSCAWSNQLSPTGICWAVPVEVPELAAQQWAVRGLTLWALQPQFSPAAVKVGAVGYRLTFTVTVCSKRHLSHK